MKLGQVGAFCCALGVACGAFGSHGLEDKVGPEQLEWWHTATTYLWYHALAILALGAYRNRLVAVDRTVYTLIAPGIFLFSGGLYLYVFTGFRTFGMIIPIGGVLLLIGWVRMGVLIHKSANKLE